MVTGTDELLTKNPTFVRGYQEPIYQSTPEDTVKAGSPITSEGLCTLAAGTSWDDGWELIVDLMVNVHTTPQEVVTFTYLTTLECGAGHTFSEAVQDLLTSLSDYYLSLISREDALGQPGVEDLSILRSLLRVKSSR